MYLAFLQEPEPQSISQWVIVVGFSWKRSPSQPDMLEDPAGANSWQRSAALWTGLAGVLGHGLMGLGMEDVSLYSASGKTQFTKKQHICGDGVAGRVYLAMYSRREMWRSSYRDWYPKLFAF